MNRITSDVLIIGAGASGLAAAASLAERGIHALVIERDEVPGGILNQCIHNGFGLHYFKEELTGPEFTERMLGRVSSLREIEVRVGTTAASICKSGDGYKIIGYSRRYGMTEFSGKAIVLAMGCRERNRGNIHIPGTRPSGIFTAGLAQRLVNMEGYIPGENVVIIGSGDIGLIMARRMRWVGANVHAVVEIQPYPSGITRNIVQCLNDYDIPLYLSHIVSRVYGKDRVEAVDITPIERGKPNDERTFCVECDTLLLSVGLIPENELSTAFGVELCLETSGPLVGATLMTSKPGVFACGNVLHVHDLVDYACEEAERCAAGVAEYLERGVRGDESTVTAGPNVRYVVPGSYRRGRDQRFYLRPLVVRNNAKLTVRCGEMEIMAKSLPHIQPSEMIGINLQSKNLESLPKDTELMVGIE